MNQPTQPPAPSKWAINAASEITDTFRPPSGDSEMDERDIPWLAAIIHRHHAAAQAETVALLEDLIALADQAMKESNNDGGEYDRDEILKEYRAHAAQLKAGAP